MNHHTNDHFPDKIFSATESLLLEDKELFRQLAGLVNELIKSDFQQLLRLLYRVDVSEQKLKLLLKENPGEDAGNLIATLIIERQLQKIKSRQENSRDDNTIDETEKW